MSDERSDARSTAARTAVEQCLGLRPGESCVVVTDEERRSVGRALYRAVREVTDEAVFACYPPGDRHGEEPPGPVAAALGNTDAFLAPTTRSLSHTRARSNATDGGARGATLPGITEEVFTVGLQADYDRIRAACDSMLARVDDAEEVRVTAPRGTDITVRPGSRAWHGDTGIVHEPGSFSNLPAGEVYVSPETADGRYVVDGTMAPHGLLEAGRTIEFVVEDGYVTDIGDDRVREEVEAAAGEVGDAAYNLAELGIGTNGAVTELVGSVLLDEKAAGTVHLAIGDDAGIGGDTEAPLHLDGIVRDPTVYVDGERIEVPAPG